MTRRVHTGLLNGWEAPLIRASVSRLPLAIQPNHLTIVSLAGALLTAVSLAACRFSYAFVIPAVLGLILNWAGDSFDGALARLRHCERARVGFLIDRCADVLSFCVIIIGLGFSPYLSLHLALMLLVAYLVNVIYGLMRLVVDGVQLIGVGGVGATEGRLVIAVWAMAFGALGLDPSSIRIAGAPVFDIACALALVYALTLYGKRSLQDITRLGALETNAGGTAIVTLAARDNIVIMRRKLGVRFTPGEGPPSEAGAEA